MARALSRQAGLLLAATTWVASPSAAASTLLYVASYAGSITTLNLTLAAGDGAATLATLSTNRGCAPNPSWLTLDKANGVLYCSDEGLSTDNGTLSSFKTTADGVLQPLDKIDTIKGPVSSVIYGDGGRGLALAQYMGSALSSFDVSKPDSLSLVQAETFTMEERGPVRYRQDTPHPHEAILDPTGQFVVVPDLGADLVRVFVVDKKTLAWTAATPLVAPRGSGPRHAVFLTTAEGKTLLFLLSELANTLTSYEVTYAEGPSLAFKELYKTPTHGEGKTVPTSVSAAEIILSPDKKSLTISSRGNSGFFSIPNFDNRNSTKISSDPLFIYSIDTATGKLSLAGSAPAGGMIPRQFTINKAGTLLAAGLQQDSRVVVMKRDPATGLLGDIIANATVEGQVTCVVFDE